MQTAPRHSLRPYIITALVAAAAIALAVIGAQILGSDTDIDAVNYRVDRLAGSSANFLGGLFGVSAVYALAVGVVSAVNPCGFVMLPAYLGLYLGGGAAAGSAGFFRQLPRALLVGLVVTAGFVLLFGIMGTLIGFGASFIARALPWFGLLVGVLLAVAGAWLVSGGKIYTGVAARAAAHIGEPTEVGIRGYFLFGVSYGIASLSCTLPTFLAVLAVSAANIGFLNILLNFILFALGMGLVIMALTLGIALFKGAMVRFLRRALPYINPIGAWLMVLAGAYIIFYWLTIGGLL